ncbi:hypothetical protein Scep_022789 [Stephania cephalantha]|uniref:Uncharacterized protein n=1 Tax=Stephania cephalantha TaxID=152367 RepID=A0AAP0I2I9_9MAGN
MESLLNRAQIVKEELQNRSKSALLDMWTPDFDGFSHFLVSSTLFSPKNLYFFSQNCSVRIDLL